MTHEKQINRKELLIIKYYTEEKKILKMTQTMNNYLADIKLHLEAVLNLRFFPSQVVERQVHPEIEFQDNPSLINEPVLISRGDQYATLIESSINSVRVSIKIKKGYGIEHLLTRMLERFMALRADKFEIFRKKPIEEYDFSFVIAESHLQVYRKEELINFIL